MIKVINVMLTVALLFTAFALYKVEYSKRAVKRDIAVLETRIEEEKEHMKLLTAEWSSMMRPDRLETHARKHLALRAVKQTQFVRMEELARRLPERTAAFEANTADDPVGAMIESFGE